MTGRAKEAISDGVDSVKEKVSGVGSTISESTPDSGDLRHGARKAGDIAQENPLGLALGAVAVGFVGGLLIPSTRVEDEKLGPMADQVKDKAKRLARRLSSAARRSPSRRGKARTRPRSRPAANTPKASRTAHNRRRRRPTSKPARPP